MPKAYLVSYLSSIDSFSTHLACHSSLFLDESTFLSFKLPSSSSTTSSHLLFSLLFPSSCVVFSPFFHSLLPLAPTRSSLPVTPPGGLALDPIL